MATPVSENPETNTYYATQAALGASTASAVRELWPFLDPSNLAGTFPTISRGAAAIASQHALAAVSLAADYYDDFRDSVGAAGSFSPPIIDAPTLAQIEAEISAGAQELLASIDAVVDDLFLAELTLQMQTEAEGSARDMVIEAGRDELFAALESDPEAKGWARVTRPTACSFCRMLATRGPIYLSRETANFRAHRPINGRGGVCQCTIEPLLGQKYEPTAQARADVALWNKVNADGFRGAEARNEFRRRVEGRQDGPRRPRGKNGKAAKPVEVQGRRGGFDELTPAQLQHQLEVLAKLPDSTYRTSQTERVRGRLAFLAK